MLFELYMCGRMSRSEGGTRGGRLEGEGCKGAMERKVGEVNCVE